MRPYESVFICGFISPGFDQELNLPEGVRCRKRIMFTKD